MPKRHSQGYETGPRAARFVAECAIDADDARMLSRDARAHRRAPRTVAAGVRITFDVPPDLWLSSNRMPSRRGHLHRIALGLHDLAVVTARVQRVEPVRVKAHASWEVQYPFGTRKADAANAQPTTKRILDGLVKAGLLEDDDSTWIVAETFRRGENLRKQRPNPANPLWNPRVHRITLHLDPTQETP